MAKLAFKPAERRTSPRTNAAKRATTHRMGPREFQAAEDIVPIAELKANMSEIVRGLDDRPRPLVVTLNGKAAAVVMSPREYDLLSYQARFREAINEGLADAAAGRTLDADQAFDEIGRELGLNKRTLRPRNRRATKARV